MEAITTAFVDEFPQLRSNLKHKSLFLALLCFVFYLMGLLLITDVSVRPVKLGCVAVSVSLCVCVDDCLL